MHSSANKELIPKLDSKNEIDTLCQNSLPSLNLGSFPTPFTIISNSSSWSLSTSSTLMASSKNTTNTCSARSCENENPNLPLIKL